MKIVNVAFRVEEVLFVIVAVDLDSSQTLSCQVFWIVHIDEIFILSTIFTFTKIESLSLSLRLKGKQLTFIQIIVINLLAVDLNADLVHPNRLAVVLIRLRLVVEVIEHHVHVAVVVVIALLSRKGVCFYFTVFSAV